MALPGVGEMLLLCLPTGFFFASVAALEGSLSSQEHLATLVCCLLWLAALLTRSLLRLPGVEYVYPFLCFAGDQHGVWLWNKAALTGTGLLLWVGWWLCGKRKKWEGENLWDLYPRWSFLPRDEGGVYVVPRKCHLEWRPCYRQRTNSGPGKEYEVRPGLFDSLRQRGDRGPSPARACRRRALTPQRTAGSAAAPHCRGVLSASEKSQVPQKRYPTFLCFPPRDVPAKNRLEIPVSRGSPKKIGKTEGPFQMKEMGETVYACAI